MPLAPPANTQPPRLWTKAELQPSATNTTINEAGHCTLSNLPYWDATLMVSYDAMHTIGGVVADLFACMGGTINEQAKAYDMSTNG